MAVTIDQASIQGALSISSQNDEDYSITHGAGNIIRMPNQPAFDAYGASTSFPNASDWIFPSIVLNNGNHYDNLSGRFTAPVNGIYQFYWSNIGGTSETYFRYYLKINGTVFNDIHLRLDTRSTGTSDYGDSAVRICLVELSAGDYVQIYYNSGSGIGSYPTSNTTTNPYPVFGGFLLG